MKTPSRKLLGLLGSILGVSAAGCGGAPTGAPVYGAPTAEYKLSGTVVDATTDAAIPGISLSFKGATTTSAANGTWSLDVHGFPCGNTCALSATDVDGTENGSYSELQVPLAPTQTAPGRGTFDQGVFEQKDIKVTLQHPSL